MDVEPGQFPSIKCGADVQVFFSSKTGERLGWSCPEYKSRVYFKGLVPGKEKAILVECDDAKTLPKHYSV